MRSDGLGILGRRALVPLAATMSGLMAAFRLATRGEQWSVAVAAVGLERAFNPLPTGHPDRVPSRLAVSPPAGRHIMPALRPVLHRIDDFQQRHAALAYPIAVWKKFGDDQAGYLCALLAFFGFLSLFPLLLVLVTVLGLLLHGNPELQHRVLNSALADFPIIGQQLKTNVNGVGRSGFGFAVGIVGSLLGARGLADATQYALNKLWAVPYTRRPGFPHNWLRSYGIIAVLGLGVLATTALSGIGAWGGHGVFGVGVQVASVALSLLVNMGLFWLAFHLATAREISWRDQWLAAALAGVVWQILQITGGLIVAHQLRNSSSLYGVFGVVLGLVAWLYLQARLTVYAVEADVVRNRHLWPRSLFPPPLNDQDKEVYRSYPQAEERVADEQPTSPAPG
jgi:YihY family inner membrane protein